MKKIGVWLVLLTLLITISTVNAKDFSLRPEPTVDTGTANNGYYTATFAENPTGGETVSFTREGITIGLQPHSLNWNNALSQIQQINMPQNVQRTQNNNAYEYNNAYGEGITLKYTNEWYGVKEEITINSLSDLGTIEQYIINGGNPYIEANFLLTTNAQHIIIEGAEWDKTTQTETTNNITIKNDEGKDLYHLPRPSAIDSNATEIYGSYKLKKSSNKLYIGITIPYTFLETAVYPVTIDPTFYVDYNPSPASYYSDGNADSPNYASFTTVTDTTSTLTDGNTNTYVTIIDTANNIQDDVLRARFSHQYELGYRYFIRIYKKNIATTNVRIRPHTTNTTINTTFIETAPVNGQGYYSIDVTDQMIYMKNLSLGLSDFRIGSTTSNGIQLSEVELRQQENDTTLSTITNCQVDNPNAVCDENITFSCIVTDDVGVDHVHFTFENGGIDQILAEKTYNLYYHTFRNIGRTGNITIEFQNVTAIDLFDNEAYYNPNLTANYYCLDNCSPIWIPQYEEISPCQTNNTQIWKKTYYDSEECESTSGIPVDNGTLVDLYCNYCDPDWQPLTGGIYDCQLNGTRYVEYIDYNFCYSTTGLTEDAPPIDDQTTQPCEYYDNDFDCYHSSDPYKTKIIDYQCELLTTQEWECTNRLNHLDGDLLQVNPQKKERTSGGLIASRTTETRTTFTSTNGLVNLYYTDKNLEADNTFIITTTCVSGNQTLSNEEVVNPELRDLIGRTAPRIIWFGTNAGKIFLLILLMIGLALILGLLVKKVKR